MPVSSVTCTATRSWTGAETLFSSNFKALDPAFCTVKTASATLVRDTHYSAELAAGTSELLIRPLGAMPAAPQTLTIDRTTPPVQTDDLNNGNSYDADAQELLFDRTVMVAQELARDRDRALALANAAVAQAQAAFDAVDEIVTNGPVFTVNGQNGHVILAKGDLGLGNVDNTADTAKPVSTAQAAAIAAAQAASSPAITGLSALAGGVDGALDKLLIYDASTASYRYVNASQVAASGAAGVTTFNGRSGAVSPASGDYTASQIPFTPYGGLAATNVQAALEEVNNETARLDGAIFTGAVETRRTNNANTSLVRLTGEVGLTNDLLARDVRRIGNLTAEDFYEYGVGNVLTWGGGGKVGVRNSTPGYELDVTGDINASGNIRLGGTALIPYRPSSYELDGLLPENVSANTMYLFNGSAATPGTAPTKKHYFDWAGGHLTLDMTVTGVGGRDTGTLASFNSQTCYVFLAPHDSNPALNSAIISKSLSAGSVVLPSGYTASNLIRHPAAYVYHPTFGLMPFHPKGGRPWSFHLTGWDTEGGVWNLTGANNTLVGTTYVDISTAAFVPNNARLVRLRVKLTADSGTGGAYVSSPGIADDKKIGWVSNPYQYFGEFEIRTNSSNVFQLKADANIRVTLQVVEYTMSDDV